MTEAGGSATAWACGPAVGGGKADYVGAFATSYGWGPATFAGGGGAVLPCWGDLVLTAPARGLVASATSRGLISSAPTRGLEATC